MISIIQSKFCTLSKRIDDFTNLRLFYHQKVIKWIIHIVYYDFIYFNAIFVPCPKESMILQILDHSSSSSKGDKMDKLCDLSLLKDILQSFSLSYIQYTLKVESQNFLDPV